MTISIYRYVEPQELCFKANTAGSTVQLVKNWSPTSVTLQTSTDWDNWSNYTIWDTITLSNVGDNVYWRNSSETDTGFGTSSSNYYYFVMSWSIAWSWDINFLLNKNSTTTVSSYCYHYLFKGCSSLTSAPSLTATTLASNCYNHMFYWCAGLTTVPELLATTLTDGCYFHMFEDCTSLTTVPKLSATTLTSSCYRSMFQWCSKIKLSETQTWEYQTIYKVPINWWWTTGTNSLRDMFTNTGWTFTWTPSINTTYYTSNTVV